DLVSIDNLSIQPDSVSNNSQILFWNLGQLAAQQDTVFTIDVTVAPNAPESTLLSGARVNAEFDTDLSNNFDSNSVPITQKLTDVAIFKTAQTGSFAILNTDTLRIVKPGENYVYRITVSNISDIEAENVIIEDVVPVFLKMDNFAAGDKIRIPLNNLAAGADTSLFLNATLLATTPPDTVEIKNTATVEAGNEDPGSLLDNASMVSVFLLGKPISGSCDLFCLDFNVFEPQKNQRLGITFELNSSSTVRMDLYDISGYRIGKMVENTFDFGANRYEWNGQIDNQKVGSGVYIITLRSRDMLCWKKVIVAR
ncbi:MAG: hypothetical protein ACE5IR_24140, partial [bacterium]